MPSQAHRPSFSRDSAEQIRRREVARILKKMNPTPEEEEAIERLSHLLVAGLPLGPISEAMTRAGSAPTGDADGEASTGV